MRPIAERTAAEVRLILHVELLATRHLVRSEVRFAVPNTT
jgi:hypothetical protein